MAAINLGRINAADGRPYWGTWGGRPPARRHAAGACAAGHTPNRELTVSIAVGPGSIMSGTIRQDADQ